MAEILLLENYSLSSSTLPSKDNRRYSKKSTKNKCACLNEVMINGSENEGENEKYIILIIYIRHDLSRLKSMSRLRLKPWLYG